MITLHEKHTRSVVKAIGYRALSISADTLAAYFFAKDIVATVVIVAIVNGYSTVLYYFHERAWAHVTWGRNK